MTRPLSDVHAVLELRALGLGARRISRRTGIPVKTVQGWLDDPDRALQRRHRGHGPGTQELCDLGLRVDPAAYSHLLGVYLGDGHIALVGRSYRLTVACDAAYPDLITQIETSMRRVLPNRTNRAQREGCVHVYAYSTHWPCLFPQHGVGRKHERPIALEPWQRTIVGRYPRLFLRGFLHTDGCRVRNVAVRRVGQRVERRHYLRYQFSNRSEDIQQLFIETCDQLGIRSKRAGRWHVNINRQEDVARVDRFVGPKR